MNEDNEQNITQDSNPVPPPPGLRKLLYKGKKAGKKVLKGAGNTLRLGFRNVWLALPSKGKIIAIIILIFVILCACAIVVLADYAVDTSNNGISSYISSLGQSSASSQFYDRTGSLLLLKDAEIKEIYIRSSYPYLDVLDLRIFCRNRQCFGRKKYEYCRRD